MKKILTAALLILAANSICAGECTQKVTIDSVAYTVPSWWCNRAIDTSLIPKFGDFMRLPSEFCYNDSKIYVRKDAGEAFVKMARAAAKDSVFIKVKSGFRSVQYQKSLFRKYLSDGTPFNKVAELVAPPGYSEHHTGRAFDLARTGPRFDKSRAYAWLKKNAAKYGFIESYPENSKSGIRWEPWHWYYGDAK